MTLKVLTVDDSRTIRRIVGRAFKPYDCEVHEAENGVEGLALACKIIPDLIILDITMPVMTGNEMLERVKQEDSIKDVPVIMLTAESGKENVTNILKMGVRDYMVKPFKDVQLIERVEKIFKLDPAESKKAQEDAGKQYFKEDPDVCIIELPANVDRQILLDIGNQMKIKPAELKQSGKNSIVLNLTAPKKVNMVLIKLIISVNEACQKSGLSLRIVATSGISSDLKGFQETQSIPVDNSVEQAKTALATG